jgi:succinyl-CoA synthetase beta subunit
MLNFKHVVRYREKKVVRLYEFQGKQLLRELGIKIPKGEIASTKEDARIIAERIGRPVIIKAQILVTGRFKAGGIKFANTPREAEAKSQELLGAFIKGHQVERVLVEERLDINKEFYAGIIAESSYKVKGPVVIFSAEGGVDIEKVANKVVRKAIDYLIGVNPSNMKSLVSRLDIPKPLVKPLSGVLNSLYKLFVKYDARAVEINPLVSTSSGEIYAADCHITIDDNSVFRHLGFNIDVPRDMERPPTELEKIAWKIEEGDYRGTAYFAQIAIDEGQGYIAFHGIGGGGAMLAVDALTLSGLKIANYADTSGDPTAAKVYRIIKTVLSQPGVEGYILMGATFASQEQWHHAHAIVKAFREEACERPGFPVLILIAGNKEKEAHEIIRRGLEGLPLRWELYGRDYIYDTGFIAQRMKDLIEEYHGEKSKTSGG